MTKASWNNYWRCSYSARIKYFFKKNRNENLSNISHFEGTMALQNDHMSTKKMWHLIKAWYLIKMILNFRSKMALATRISGPLIPYGVKYGWTTSHNYYFLLLLYFNYVLKRNQTFGHMYRSQVSHPLD